MAYVLGESFITFNAKTSKLHSALQSITTGIKKKLRLVVGAVGAAATKIRPALQSITAGVKKVGLVVGAAGTAAIYAGIKFVKMASDVEETSAKFKTVFKEQSKAVEAFAVSLSKSIGGSRYEFMRFLASMQDTFVPLGFARDKSAELSKAVVQLGMDLASFNNVARGDALRDLQSALVGNHETVRKYGIIITEAALNQELLNMGFKGGTRAATEQQKVMARLSIIMKSSTDAQGDAIRTSKSFANQFRAFKGELYDLAVSIGKTLLPTAKKIVSVFRNLVSGFGNFVSTHSEQIAQIVSNIVAVIGGVFVSIGEYLSSFYNSAKKATSGLGTLSIMAQTFVTAGNLVRGTLYAIATAIAAVVGGVFMLVNALKSGINMLVNWATGNRKANESLTRELKENWLTYKNLIKDLAKETKNSFENAFSNVNEQSDSLIDKLTANINKFKDKFNDAFKDTGKNAKNTFKDMKNLFGKDFLAGLAGGKQKPAAMPKIDVSKSAAGISLASLESVWSKIQTSIKEPKENKAKDAQIKSEQHLAKVKEDEIKQSSLLERLTKEQIPDLINAVKQSNARVAVVGR